MRDLMSMLLKEGKQSIKGINDGCDGMNENIHHRLFLFKYVTPVGDTIWDIQKEQPCWSILCTGLRVKALYHF